MPVVGAGLQREVGGRTLSPRARLLQSAHLGVGAAARLGPASADDQAVTDQDAAHSGVGPDIAQAPSGKAQGVGHVIGVFRPGAHSSAALPGRSSLTKPSKSSAVWKFL